MTKPRRDACRQLATIIQSTKVTWLQTSSDRRLPSGMLIAAERVVSR